MTVLIVNVECYMIEYMKKQRSPLYTEGMETG